MGYEVDFLPVGDGNGDAICIRYGDQYVGYTIHVVDGGFSGTSQAIIDHIESHYGSDAAINHMVLTHADNDHAMGLIDVLEHFDVGAIWMNRPWLYSAEVLDHFHGNYTLAGLITRMKDLHPYLIKIEEIAAKKGVPIYETFQGTLIGKFRVLAPSRERYISLIHELDKTPQSYKESVEKSFGQIVVDAAKSFKEWIQEKWGAETLGDDLNTSASNETCIVQIASFETGRVLLTADVGPIGLMEAADYAQTLGQLAPPKFVQVPHHGSRHNVSRSGLNRWLGQPLADDTTTRGTAFCSVGKGKADYPRRIVSNAFLRRGYPVYSTRSSTKHHFHDMSSRNWGAATPEPFYEEVEV